MFFICAGVYLFGLSVYLVFASGEEQKWAKVESLKDTEDLEMTIEEHKQQLERLK